MALAGPTEPDPGGSDPGGSDPRGSEPRGPVPGGSVDRRGAYTVALFVAVTWAAVVFAVDGLLAVVLNRDPVPPGVSIYYGLASAALAGVVVWILSARAPAAPHPALSAAVAAAAVYLVLVGSAAFTGLQLVFVQATSPFAACAAIVAAAAVLGTRVGVRSWRARERRGSGR